MIGIAITTRNRPDVLKRCLENMNKHLPKDAVLIVVDDASDTPIESDYRFDYNAGIPAAKNKCIELLMNTGCTHFFLFDDDTWPVTDDWHLPYIESGIKHLSFTFTSNKNGKNNGRKLIWNRNGISNYTKPCGCMLYFTREVVDKIGGFDPDYIQWGFEHIDFSLRAFNMNLTKQKYMDVSNSLTLFHSMDWEGISKASVSSDVKIVSMQANKERFTKLSNHRRKIKYDHPSGGIVLAAYLNSVNDPQRGEKWKADIDPLKKLIESCERNGVDYRIFHDCLDVDNENLIKVERQTEYAPNVYRWFLFKNWLDNNKVDNVFMVDSTDVEVLRNPFLSINPDKLYVGDEYAMRVDNGWMRNNQELHLKTLTDYRKVISTNSRNILPNCGITGGAYDIVMEYLNYRVELQEKHTKGLLHSTDMAIFNYIVWKYFKNRITTGLKVNTKFKKYEYNKVSLFKHK